MPRLPSMSKLATIAVGLPLLVGCSATVDGAEEESVGEPVQTTTQGFVLVQRSATDAGLQTSVSAKFYRTSDSELAEASWMIGLPLAAPDLGQCEVDDGLSSTDEEFLVDGVELLDVGDLRLRFESPEAGESTLELAPRAFPDLGGLVSGVFYTSPDAGQDLPAPGSYSLEGSGAAAVDGFLIEAEAPEAPLAVTVAGAALDEGHIIQIAPRLDVDVRWLPQAADDVRPEQDRMVVELVGTDATLRCSWSDTGMATIPADALALIGVGPATVGIHRVREIELGADALPPGVQAGEVRFDLSVIGKMIVGDGS